MEKNTYTWVPFYKELAVALLQFRYNRKELVNWIYSELSLIKGDGGKCLVDYLHEKDGSHIVDIDPFSVFAIFNRATSFRSRFVEAFKNKFSLNAAVPTDFDGIPVVDTRRSFFFSWEADNEERIEKIWRLFEKALKNEDFSEEFDYLINLPGLSYGITMCLFWICPDKYLSLDSRNRDYLESIGIPIKSMPNFESYINIVKTVRQKIDSGVIPYKSFPELSFEVWHSNGVIKKVWVWSCGNLLDVVAKDYIETGAAHNKIGNFAQYKTEAELKKAISEQYGTNQYGKKTKAYWQFMDKVSIGDIVVINKFVSVKKIHNLYGWGVVTSDCEYIMEGENRIRRRIKWHTPILTTPVIADKMTNTEFFHDTNAEQVAQILDLLHIDMNASMDDKNYIDLLIANHNIILNGAPGTGKTFLAKKIAEAMGAKVKMVQFHPSYDYTDFVEGLRSVKDDNGNVGFERKDGVFKEFCRKALLSSDTSSSNDLFEDLNDNPTVWKVSLCGTGDNPIRKDCLEHGRIRIGWSSYGDVDDFNDFEEFKDGGKTILRSFQHTMQVGDIVLSCYSEKEIDAIGIVEGDYEYNSEFADYPRYRKVKWLVKDIREDIRSLNRNKVMTLSTVYKMPIKLKDIVDIVNRNTLHKTKNGNGKCTPFVFIIDEINRGEISKIFGELFFSIDPGYRGEKGKVQTQYQNLVEDGDVFKDGFFVPENVYIIGTMNDIDRSVESMDFAMRRRFAWHEVTAEESAKNMGLNEELTLRMTRLNDVISNTEGLGSAYHVGGSFFLKVQSGEMTVESLWNLNLKSLMKEYLRGLPDADEVLESMENAYFLKGLESVSGNEE